jgi:vancomycin permeability regulator SanA
MGFEGRLVITFRRYMCRVAGCAAVGALVLTAFVAGANAWVHARARGRAFSALADVPARAIAIVPGSPTSRRQVKASLEGRVEGALALYRSGRARAILVSGVDTAADPETSAMRRWLEERGVPAHDIVSDPLGTRTRETMYRAMSAFSVDRAIVCTEEMNMPRALFLAERNGIDAVGYELASSMSGHPRYVIREALKTTLALIEETLVPRPRAVDAARGAAVALR